jgi:endoglucanase
MKRTLTLLLLFSSYFLSKAQTAVDAYGQLSVQGNQIVDQSGNPVQLKGMSLFWSQWIGKYWNSSVVDHIADEWCANVIRCPLAVEADNGYLERPSIEREKVRDVVKAAVNKGIYVIIDWHSHEAQNYTDDAVEFFETMAEEFGSYPNVIYEIYNEPLSVSWSGVIKPYAETVIDAIRAKDPDNLIIVGTPKWSQDVDVAANSPIDRPNIAYTLHYYAASHGDWLRAKAQTALNRGIALFVTEYGVCEASGDGAISTWEANQWWDFLDDNKIGHCNWSIADKDETAAALNSGASISGNWTDDDLTESGLMVKNELTSQCPDYSGTFVRIDIPTKIEAEDYHFMEGVETETTEDIGGGENVSHIDVDDYIQFEVKAEEAGNYLVTYRVASNSATGFDFYIDDEIDHSISIENTGGYQEWIDLEHKFALEAGNHSFKLVATAGDWNINYLNFDYLGIDPLPIPSRVEAEEFSDMSGMQMEETEDDGGGLNVGWVDTGDWIEFYVEATKTDFYRFEYRVASNTTDGDFNLFVDGVLDHNMTFAPTGGWQIWESHSTVVELEEGTHTIRIEAESDGWNINYIDISLVTAINPYQKGNLISVYPNPATSGKFSVQVPSELLNNTNVLKLLDEFGRVRHEQLVDEKLITISTDNLEDGWYFLQLDQEVERIFIHRD